MIGHSRGAEVDSVKPYGLGVFRNNPGKRDHAEASDLSGGIRSKAIPALVSKALRIGRQSSGEPRLLAL